MSQRINFKIGRSITINVGNYEMIKPTIEIELLDVPLDNVGDIYSSTAELIDELFKIEEANQYIEVKSIRETKIGKHISSIAENIEKIEKSVIESLSKINKSVSERN